MKNVPKLTLLILVYTFLFLDRSSHARPRCHPGSMVCVSGRSFIQVHSTLFCILSQLLCNITAATKSLSTLLLVRLISVKKRSKIREIERVKIFRKVSLTFHLSSIFFFFSWYVFNGPNLVYLHLIRFYIIFTITCTLRWDRRLVHKFLNIINILTFNCYAENRKNISFRFCWNIVRSLLKIARSRAHTSFFMKKLLSFRA